MVLPVGPIMAQHDPYSIPLSDKFVLLFKKIGEIVRKTLIGKLGVVFAGATLFNGVASLNKIVLIPILPHVGVFIVIFNLALAVATVAFSVFFLAGFCLSTIPQIGGDRSYWDKIQDCNPILPLPVRVAAVVCLPITIVTAGFLLGNHCWHNLK